MDSENKNLELLDEKSESLLKKRTATENSSNIIEEAPKKLATSEPVDASNNPIRQASIKILCPSEYAGSIIGRGGTVISSINQISGASIRVSQNGEYYPTTTDRVIFIFGEPNNLYIAVDHVIKVILDNQDVLKGNGSIPVVNNYQVRILVPLGCIFIEIYFIFVIIIFFLIFLAAAGCIIGKGGIVIKSINEKSGAKLKMSDSSDPYHTNERIMNITAENLQKMAYAVKLVVAQLMTDKVGVYSNTSTKYSVSVPPASLQNPAYTSSSISSLAFGGIPTQSNVTDPSHSYLKAPGIFHPSALAPSMYDPNSLHLQSAMAMNFPGMNHSSQQSIQNATMSFGVPDKLIGSVVGKAGVSVKELMRATGTIIKVEVS